MDPGEARRRAAVEHLQIARSVVEADDVPAPTAAEIGVLLGRMVRVLEEIARDVADLRDRYERDQSSILRERAGHYSSPSDRDPA
jgi:hypothetical protein